MVSPGCKPEISDDGLELTVHGTEEFPVAFYEDDFSIHSLPWHWHDELELFIVVQGSVRFRTSSGQYIINEGEGLFINGGMLHAAWNNGTERCIFHSIVFHPRLIGGHEESVFWHKYLKPMFENDALKTVLLKGASAFHKEILHRIEESWQLGKKKGRGYEFFVRENLSRIIYLLDSQCESVMQSFSDKQLRNANRMKAMLQYIEEHLAENMTIEEIADAAAISVSECLRCFKTTIGVTPIQYVRQVRIQKAAELLRYTCLNVSEVAVRCGFQEMSYFAKIFRQIHGVTPSEFRK